MSEAAPLQVAFNNGEVTPKIHTHVTLDKYFSSVAQMVGVIGIRHGGAQRRTGSRFVKPAKNNTGAVRLIELKFNILQNYQVEIGENYFRFFTQQGQVESTPGVPFEVSSPYADEHIKDLDFTGSADVLFISHEEYPPAKLTRTSPSTFVYEVLDIIDGPYLESNLEATLTLDVTGSPSLGRTIIASGGHAPFTLVTDIGRLIRINMLAGSPQQQISYKITNVISDVEVQADIQLEDPATVPDFVAQDWRLGAWSTTTTYPARSSFHQGRFCLGGGKNEEAQTFNFSESGEFTKFSPSNLDGDIVASNGIRTTIDTDEVNAILWMKSSLAFIIGTSGSEFSIISYDDQPLSPTNIKVIKESQFGSKAVAPQYIGKDLIFIQRNGRKVRELASEVVSGSLVATDASLLAEHITESGISDMAYQQDPEPVIWMTREDGLLLSFTLDKSQNVRSWARQPIGGQDVKTLTVSSTESSDANRDEIWMIVERTINGATVRYVEFLEKEFDFESSLEDAFFVDSGATYEGSLTSVLTGLDHLEGETVQILGDGSVREDKVVVAGSVDVSGSKITKATVGLKYESFIETLTPEAPTPTGASLGKLQRIFKVTINLYRSLGLKYGKSLDSLDILPFRKTNDIMNEPVPLFTGQKDVVFPAGWDTNGRVIIKQDQPLPMTILSLVPRMKIEKIT